MVDRTNINKPFTSLQEVGNLIRRQKNNLGNALTDKTDKKTQGLAQKTYFSRQQDLTT